MKADDKWLTVEIYNFAPPHADRSLHVDSASYEAQMAREIVRNACNENAPTVVGLGSYLTEFANVVDRSGVKFRPQSQHSAEARPL